jgi:hypothetical protein
MKRLFFLLGMMLPSLPAATNAPSARRASACMALTFHTTKGRWTGQLVASQDVQFAFVKATEGQASMQDTHFL